jgi:citrate lyase beta subunit
VNICNEAFSPTQADVDWARAVTVAYDAAMAAGKGVCVVNGKLIEALHVQQAQEILATHAVIAETQQQ